MTGDRGASLRANLLRHPVPALSVLAAALWYLLWHFGHTDLTLDMRAAQIAWFFSAFLVFLIAVGVVGLLDGQASRRVVVFIIAVGVLLRLSLAPVRPVTTSDIYRYLWEGRVVNAGENPFRDPPNSPRLSRLHDWVWRLVQLQDVPAAYPPVTQYVFALSDRLPTDRIIALKLIFALFDIGTLLLLPGLLVALGRPRKWVLLYAWHPLMVGEVVARGHLDSVGIFFLVLAMRVLALPSPRARALAGAALAASVLAKGYAILALPFLLLSARPRRLWFVLGFASATVAAYLPFASAGWSVLDGIRIYSRDWVGYGSVFPLLDAALTPLTPKHTTAARVACGIGIVSWVILLLARRRGDSRLETACDSTFLALAGLYLFSPVLYPWYLSWTVPFLCLRPRPGWLIFTGTVFLFYAQAFTPVRTGFWYVSLLEYGVPLLVAGAFALRGRSGRAPGDSR